MNSARKAYIEKYKSVVVKSTAGSGLFPSVMMAQAVVESNNGTSRLAVSGNNHFGIKCHGWKGKTIIANDDKPNECFRAYDSALESFYDRNRFLLDNPRYTKAGVFNAKTPLDQLKALKAAGYATAPNYVNVVYSIIKTYNLESLDAQKKELPPFEVISATYSRANKIKLLLRIILILVLIIQLLELRHIKK